MDALKKFFELTEKGLAVLTKISFVLGGAILLVYCGRYGGFPDGLSLSDTLRIFLVVTVFSMGTLAVYFFMMCLGFSILHPIILLARMTWITRGIHSLKTWIRGKIAWRRHRSHFSRNYKRQSLTPYHLRFSKLTPCFYAIAFLSVFLIPEILPHNHIKYLQYFCASLMLGLAYILVNWIRQIDAQMNLVIPDVEKLMKKRAEIRLIKIVFPGVIIVYVTAIYGLFNATANRTMEILGIRHEHATVFVQAPWNHILQKHGVKSSPDDSVPGHMRFNDVTVALSSFGNSVTLSVGDEHSSSVLRIPVNAVVIDTLKDQRQAEQ
ncbi:hypothetical protein LU196_18960 [Pantoea sp. Mb-10]|uniref:hypothetical protein n=1 Tax=unclassified Pantoea TaxID=2630326 RepID=UPI001E334528|nr:MULTISPECIES: hypothetical protein [unclassified Pantoea]MCE0492117.1 hypothetical protein [Pantoea sp. Mb-10]MCE0502455.1 hypothetical protein [Pantoea sp. Pb-8]